MTVFALLQTAPALEVPPEGSGGSRMEWPPGGPWRAAANQSGGVDFCAGSP